jgi:hypothetical protein
MSAPKPRGARRLLLTVPLKRRPGSFPFRDWGLPHKRIVFQALHAAWNRVVQEAEDAGGDLLVEQEPAITVRLEKALNEIQNEPEHPSGFSGAIFQTVVRGGEVTSYDHKALEKRPDLAFRLYSVEPGLDRSLFALFAECKLVGPKNSIHLYCSKGIHRFVCGDYAWTMPTGLMIGYTYSPLTIPNHLASYLRRAGRENFQTRVLPRRFPAALGVPPVYETRHDRPWVFPEDRRSPGEIALLHFWLPLPHCPD